MPSALPARTPWPMKWIVLAIILFIGGYTYLTLHFRKPGRSYEPYADMKNRANTERLLSAGYQKFELPVQRPADVAMQADVGFPAAGGLPADLRTTVVSPRALPSDILAVHASATASSRSGYDVQFRCRAPDDRQQLAGVEVFIKGNLISLAPNFESLSGGLQARTRDTVATFSIAPGTLKAGSYRVTLVGENSSRTWNLDVR